MNRKKRHHYVPQMLSRWFADEEGKLYFFDKRMKRGSGVKRSTPKKIFAENNLYTSEFDGVKDIETEEFFAELEGKASPLVSRIIESARLAKFYRFTPAEKDLWALFVFTLIARSPDTLNDYMPRLSASELLIQHSKELYETENVSAKEVESLIRRAWPLSLREIDEKMRLEVLPTLTKMSTSFAVIPQGQFGLVIGSSPSMRVGYSADIRDPNTQLWIAIAHDIVAVITHDETGILGNLTYNDMCKYNEEVGKSSTVFAGRHRKLIDSLVDFESPS